MRDRLIKKIGESLEKRTGMTCKLLAENIADDILAGGAIVPPCKVGDTVYVADCSARNEPLRECEVTEIGQDRHYPYIVVEPKGFRGRRRAYPFRQIGKTVFLTREEAEKALKGGASDAD